MLIHPNLVLSFYLLTNYFIYRKNSFREKRSSSASTTIHSFTTVIRMIKLVNKRRNKPEKNMWLSGWKYEEKEIICNYIGENYKVFSILVFIEVDLYKIFIGAQKETLEFAVWDVGGRLKLFFYFYCGLVVGNTRKIK